MPWGAAEWGLPIALKADGDALWLLQVLWGAADYGAKVVFSSHLWQKNLSTVQQRREAAQELMGVLDRWAGVFGRMS